MTTAVLIKASLPLCLLIPHPCSCPSAGPEKLQHSITTYMSSAPSPSQVSVYTLRNKGGGESTRFSPPAQHGLVACPPLLFPCSDSPPTVSPTLLSFSSSFHRPPPSTCLSWSVLPPHSTQVSSSLCSHLLPQCVCTGSLFSVLSPVFFVHASCALLCPRQLLIFRMTSVSLKEILRWIIVLALLASSQIQHC